MEDSENACTEILVRLRPILERIFATYGISEREAEEIMESPASS